MSAVSSTVIFRVNADPIIGFGHLYRARALAAALLMEGLRSVIVGPSELYSSSSDASLFLDWNELQWVDAITDARALCTIANLKKSKILVLDDYRINYEYQRILRDCAFKWAKFESSVDNPVLADIVINASPGVLVEDYGCVLHHPPPEFLLGPKFALLREEFTKTKPRPIDRCVRKILVAFGGGDDRGAISWVLLRLLPVVSKDIQLIILSGKHNPNNIKLKQLFGSNKFNNASLFVDPSNVAQLIKDCDLAIMAGGTMTYEAAFFGLPMLIISIAQNQVAQSLGWEYLGVARYLGPFEHLSEHHFVNEFTSFISNFDELCKMRRLAHENIGGLGAKLVACAISGLSINKS